MERLIDAAARELGIDAAEIRRRNFIPPDAYALHDADRPAPTTAATSSRCMDSAMAEADWHTASPAARRRPQQRGKLRGLGISNYIERCGGGGGRPRPAASASTTDGTVTVLSRHASPTARATRPPIQPDRLPSSSACRSRRSASSQGDTDRIPVGQRHRRLAVGPDGRRRTRSLAADTIIEKGTPVAARRAGGRRGRYRVPRTAASRSPARTRDLAGGGGAAVASIAAAPAAGHRDLASTPRREFTPESHTFPNGCHICEVEVDPETGVVELVALHRRATISARC